MLHIAMATHYLKGTYWPPNQILKISDDVTVKSFLNLSQKVVFLFVIPRSISVQNLSKIGQEAKKLQKIRNGVILTTFLKIAQQFFVCE